MHIVETFCDDYNDANTYLIFNDSECIVIDPASNIKTLSKFIGDKNLKAILLTHGHYDHFKELRNLLKNYDVKCYMHEEAYKKINDPNSSFAVAFGCKNLEKIEREKVILITKNQTINIGQFKIQTFHLPGHTNCSIAYLINDDMFVGDVVFKTSIGRTDLVTGNSIAMLESIRFFKILKNNYTIYPGHDEKTSVFELIKYNPYFKNN